MKNQLLRLLKPLILSVLFLLVITNCQSCVGQYSEELLEQSTTSSDCRIVQHTLGKTCIPVKPRRIVALDPYFILDPLLSLGIKPVGTSIDNLQGKDYWGALSSEDVAGIERVGQTPQPSLERILMLKPDLILGTNGYGTQYYNQLSAIAPTILRDFRTEVEPSFKEHFRFIAQVVGQQEKAEEVLSQYQKRVEELHKAIGSQMSGIQVSVIHSAEGIFNQPGIKALFFQIMNDTGINIKSIFMDKPEWSTLSIEVINQYDADVVFILGDYGIPRTYLIENSLITSLKAFQNGRFYIVDLAAWMGYGPSAWNRILDDLSKYLLESK
ncbi:ABC transporter substrate-binding protein [Microcoleus sp. herbarium7]|uniref:ABC transporter substrate-binding protein n=1 Tax=Microcoleus sp. herbarium7 TaxID=3055435 RepID=UPI002FD6ECBE